MTGAAKNTTGYSGTPLAKKLGIREGSRVRTAATPDHYLELLRPLPEGVTISTRIARDIDIFHLFVRSASELSRRLEAALEYVYPDGVIWVSWPKKASGVATDLSEDRIREAALPLGLVDIKVCAVDAVWSGLKLVVRKRHRE